MRDTPLPLGSADQLLAATVLTSFGGFMAQVAALWELTTICEASVRPRDLAGFDRTMTHATEGSLAGLSDETRLRVGQAGAAWVDAMQELPLDQVGVAFGVPHGTPEASVAVEEAEAAFASLIQAYPDIERAGTFVIGFLDALTAVPRADLMYESIVTAAVSGFESQLRTIIAAVERERQPDLGERELGLEVERSIRGGWTRWMDWMAHSLGLALAHDDATLHVREILQRRNLFVHHGGLVSPHYVRHVPRAPRLGTRLTADAGYTHAALVALLVLGTQIAVRSWSAFKPTFAPSAELLAGYLGPHYLAPVEAWPALTGLCSWLMHELSDPLQRDLARVMAAVGEKRQGRVSEARTLLETLDPTREDFRLVRHALLDEMDTAFALAAAMLARGSLTTFDLKSWPALAEMREDARWSELVQDPS